MVAFVLLVQNALLAIVIKDNVSQNASKTIPKDFMQMTAIVHKMKSVFQKFVTNLKINAYQIAS